VSRLLSIIEKFSGIKVLVVGDVMLDRYWWGSVRRISPEAPVPVVNLEKTSLVAGGAANVAANIAGLGAEPLLVGVVGQDDEALLVPQILSRINVSADYLVKVKDRPTTIKTRIVAHSQHVVRIDQEDSQPIDFETEKKLEILIEKTLKSADVVLISDYAKGVLTETVLTGLITKANEMKKPVLVDPKGREYQKYRNAALLTPNRIEAALACNLDIDGQNLVEKAGSRLLKDLEVGAVLITQGEKGMTLFRNGEKPFHLDSLARNVYDVTGAGDTVIAGLGAAVGAGADLAEAAEIANIAAGLVVEEVGTTAIDVKKLKEAIAAA
jgi:D-glycero-beta-D-manno-heptose-7-phosphate kinase